MARTTNESRFMTAYPQTHRANLVETLHNTEVADPYRWLEEIDSAKTQEWIKAQNKVSHDYLSQLPGRSAIHARLEDLWNYERLTVPVSHGGRLFYSHNDGLQNQNVLYWADSRDGKPKVLIDPNRLSDEGTVALIGFNPSYDGRYVAYGLSSAGSDWQEWRIREVESNQDLDEVVRWAKTWSVGWNRANKGFYYGRFDAPPKGEEYKAANFFQKLFFHRIGTSQSEDQLVYERPDHKDWRFHGYVTEDNRYLIITVYEGTRRENAVFYQNLVESPGKTIELLDQFEAGYHFLGNDGSLFYFKTNHDAPLERVIAIDIEHPDPDQWREIVPEHEHPLTQVSLLNESMLAAHYLQDAHSRIEILNLDGQTVRTLDLPGMGTVSGFHGERDGRETYYQFSNFSQPGATYQYNMETGETCLFHRPEVDFDPEDYVTDQIFCTSKDGTQVPMFVCYKRSLDLHQPNPAFLYGYGGFNIPLTPAFSPRNLVWMEMGGIFIQVNLRGGGEYGRNWYQAGTKERKQNVFDDFIAAAEHLIATGYTTTEKLAIGGGSNGGLLVGACMTQRPDLFGACLVAVGVLDMIRFHRFTVGWGWVSDYGSPDDPDEFGTLLAYSPYHNLRPGTAYPATLITTGDHDDRVFPAHSFKFAAALQHAQAGDAPILLRIATRAGHGAGKPTAMLIAEWADIWAFLLRALT